MISLLGTPVSRRLSLVLISMILTASPLAASPSIVIDSRSIDVTDKAIPQQWLDKARVLNVSFGHQSVGDNIVDGLKTLARQNPGRYRLAIQADPTPAWFAANKGLGHYHIGRNGDPDSKTVDFTRHVRLQAGHVEVAMMKFCFVDSWSGIFRSSDPQKLFASYVETMERLERAHPAVRFVWWTQPLARSGNGVRNRYNALVRNYALSHGKFLFDIADIESHDPSGRETRNFWGEPGLYEGYTRDGGHLIAIGQLRATRAWWWMMARLAGWPGPKR